MPANNITRLAQLMTPSPTSRAEGDRTLWEAWKKTPTDANLTALLNRVNGLIQTEVTKWQGTLARPLLEAEGKRLAVGAFHTYDPNRGAALGTHVANALLKLSRLSYSHQNVARLPENKVLKFHTYKVTHAQLADELGRPPTVDELADRLAWSIPHLTSFQRDITHQEILESGGTTDAAPTGITFGVEDEDHTIDFIHHDLPALQKSIFEHLTGYGGTKQLSNQEIMKKLSLTQGQYSYAKRLLIDHLEKVTAGR